MTIAIAYNAGSYGTYLEWCLSSLTTDVPLISPLTTAGNSHKFFGNHLLSVSGWEKFLSSKRQASFVRFHPKSVKEHSLNKNLDYVCSFVDFLLYVYPSRDHVLLTINNYITKIWEDWWGHNLSKDIDINVIYQNWPVSPGVPADKIPNWIRREFLSFYLMPAWFDQVEWYHPDKWHNTKACIVTTQDLLFDFENTLSKIQKHTNLKFVRSTSELLPIHKQNLELQRHLGQDQLCKDIIDSAINDVSIDWNPLPFGSEVWLQWELRNRGFEIRCDGLDTFPTNSVQLKELLYPV